MSADAQAAVGRREVAWRLFAAEFDDADLDYSDSDEERAPNYVITPAGCRINRLFVVGVLTEVESVSDDVLRARVVDPTGAFVLYAGQYQPDAVTFLERADVPSFVAVTGKARTYRPDGSDQVFTSIRPESINEVDAETRDRWTVQAAEHTLDRVATFAGALEREERGDALRDALLDEGVAHGLAAGIPLAIDHYGTTAAYLAAVRDLALDAVRVVAGERDEVTPLAVAPDETGAVDVDLAAGSAAAASRPEAADANAEAGAEPATAEADAPEESTPAAEPTAPVEPEPATEAADAEADPSDATVDVEDGTEARPAADVETADAADEADELGDFDEYGTDDEPADEDALYELDDEEREHLEAEYGTEFTTGTEVAAPGEAGIENESPDDTESEPEPAAPAEPEVGTDADDAETEAEAEEATDEVDLEDAAVEAMSALDEGDGADRAAVVETVVEAHGVDPAAVEDAIQDALMSGRCYEPSDGQLKAI